MPEGPDDALNLALEVVRRGGTVSLSGVYSGTVDPLPMLNIFGVEDFATHRVPLEDARRAYEIFQKKDDGAIKVVLSP